MSKGGWENLFSEAFERGNFLCAIKHFFGDHFNYDKILLYFNNHTICLSQSFYF